MWSWAEAVVMVVVVVMMIAIVVMTIVRVVGDGHHRKCDNHNDKNPQDGCVMTMNLQWEWLHVTPKKKQETHKKGELFDSPNSVVSVKQKKTSYNLIGSMENPWILSSEGAIGPSFHCFFLSASLSQRHQPLVAIQGDRPQKWGGVHHLKVEVPMATWGFLDPWAKSLSGRGIMCKSMTQTRNI